MKRLICLFIVATLLGSCTKSEFVPDAINNSLPEYSESGRNVAGAFINDTAWRCQVQSCFTCISQPFTIGSSLTGDSTIFLFDGLSTSNSVNFIDGSGYNVQTFLRVVIKGLKIENPDSLFKLNNKTFLLDGTNSYASISKKYQSPAGKGTGSFTINKIQKGLGSFGDGSPNNPKMYPFIVSGRFDFTIYTDRKYVVKDGRFDMDINF